MRITTKSKYGMRMIVEIAAQPEGKAASLKSIARKINASEKYLEQIVIPLTKARVSQKPARRERRVCDGAFC